MGEREVVRMHLRSTVEGVDHLAIEARCLRQRNGCAGVGWGLWDGRSAISWKQYRAAIDKRGERVNDSVQLLHDLPIGSLVWTRRRDGSYWLGEITGDWEYHGDETAEGLDLFNVRRCRWSLAGTEDAVPGKIVSNFRAPKTVNRVTDRAAVRFTNRLHMQLRGGGAKLEPVPVEDVIRTMLGAEALEDLVAVYLQDTYGLILVARGQSTPGYEYVLRSRKTGRRAVCSVKSGGTPVDLDRLPKHPDIDCYAYAVSGTYAGSTREDVVRIATDELARFMVRRRLILPDRVAGWLV